MLCLAVWGTSNSCQPSPLFRAQVTGENVVPNPEPSWDLALGRAFRPLASWLWEVSLLGEQGPCF